MSQDKQPCPDSEFTYPDGRIKASVLHEAVLVPLQNMSSEQFIAELLAANPQLDLEQLGLKPDKSQPKAS